MSEKVFRTGSREETIALGERLGRALAAGDVLVLTGDLGAGKTQLTKGIAAGMGVTDDVTSPTFTIEMVYEGAEMPLYHFDLYRLDDPDQLEDTGIFDVLGADGVCSIEWGEQFADGLLEEEHVAVVPGNAFGSCGEDHIRCSYATGMAELEEAVARIGRFLEKLRKNPPSATK